MNKFLLALIALLVTTLLAAPAMAENRMIAGHQEKGDLIETGVADVATSPGRIFLETSEDVSNFGAGGIITGPVVGGIKGAGQAAMGGGRILIGILDFLSAPIRESRYNRDRPGSLR